MNVQRPRAVAVGALCATRLFQVEHIPAPPAKVLAKATALVIDGMAVSAACAFVRLGGEAALWMRQGDDAQGREATAALASEGLDVRHVRVVKGAATSHATVIVDARGERLVVPFHDPKVDASPDWLPLGLLNDVDFVLADVRWPEGAAATFRAARDHGLRTMLDADVAPPQVLQALLPLCTHAVFSDAGLAAYTGLQDVEAGLRAVVSQHADVGWHHVGASCGAHGYVWLDAREGLQRVLAPRVDVVDTLAAGDVFHGAFALALARGEPVEQAARYACYAASLKCTRFGGRLGCPTHAEVLTLMQTEANPTHASKPD
jgi:sulfofructose kinase